MDWPGLASGPQVSSIDAVAVWLVGWLAEESGGGLVWAGLWPAGLRHSSIVAVVGWL